MALVLQFASNLATVARRQEVRVRSEAAYACREKEKMETIMMVDAVLL